MREEHACAMVVDGASQEWHLFPSFPFFVWPIISYNTPVIPPPRIQKPMLVYSGYSGTQKKAEQN